MGEFEFFKAHHQVVQRNLVRPPVAEYLDSDFIIILRPVKAQNGIGGILAVNFIGKCLYAFDARYGFD